MWILVLAALGVFALTHTAPFPFALDALARDRAVWRMPRAEGRPTIYLTFDDGPNPEATPAVLDVLAREGAKATFFLIDRHLTPETAPIVRRALDEGHAVALHSHTRALMVMKPDDLAATLTAAADRIEGLAGRRPCRAFRPHAGWRSSSMFAGLARIDYVLVGWGWMLWDWNGFRARTAAAIVPRLVRRASPGDIIVIHDGHHVNPRADRRYAVEAAAMLIPALRERGFTFGTICDASGRVGPATRIE